MGDKAVSYLCSLSPTAGIVLMLRDKSKAKKSANNDDGGEEGGKPKFAPRQAKTQKQEMQYKDRAAIRRAGGDGEYKEVSHPATKSSGTE